MADNCPNRSSGISLEEVRKPYISLEVMKISQRLLVPQNPKIGSTKLQILIDSTIVKKIEDSGFFDMMNAQYRG